MTPYGIVVAMRHYGEFLHDVIVTTEVVATEQHRLRDRLRISRIKSCRSVDYAVSFPGSRRVAPRFLRITLVSLDSSAANTDHSMYVVVPDGGGAVRARLPRHRWQTFPVSQKVAAVPNGGLSLPHPPLSARARPSLSGPSVVSHRRPPRCSPVLVMPLPLYERARDQRAVARDPAGDCRFESRADATCADPGRYTTWHRPSSRPLKIATTVGAVRPRRVGRAGDR
jgi:hypothetical protein